MKKYLLTLLIFISAFSIIPRNFNIAYAETECDIVNEAFLPNLLAADLGIPRTVLDVFTAIVFAPIGWVYGVGANDLVGCATQVEIIVGSFTTGVQTALGNGGLLPGSNDCVVKDETVCDALIKNNDSRTLESYNSNVLLGRGNVYQKSVNGSLLGISNNLESYVKEVAPPVNLAYAWNRTIAKVPFANKALAASQPADNLPMIKMSAFAWQFSRNIALGLMSIVLLYTGIMIVMRKKVSSQLVVSVQYAIPKILLGIVLIIFSYTIGALIASIGWGVFKGGEQIIYGTFLGDGLSNMSSGLIVVFIAINLFRYTLGSIPALLMVILGSLFVILLKIAFYFKAFLIYMKMVFSIITAPLEIVLGTVPGSESKITDWFKRMAKYAITLLIMGMIIPITLMLAMGVVLSFATGSEVGGWGILMSVLAPLVIIALGFFVGLSVEAKVDAMFTAKRK